MASVMAIISKAAFAKLRTSDDQVPTVGAMIEINRYDSDHPTLDALKARGALYLVTVRPDDTLWLAAVLGAPRRSNHGWRSQGNLARVVDLTPLCDALGLERGDGKLAMRLQTPRALDQRVEAILDHVVSQAGSAAARKVSYTASAPERLLRAPAIAAPGLAPKPKPVKGGKLPPLAGALGEPCLAQLDEVLDEARASPERLLQRAATAKAKGKRGPFTETLQSIFAGAIDAAEATRMLRKELEPWLDDATRKAMAKPKGDLDAYFGELVDDVATRAVDDLCAGMVGFAIDRVDLVPEVCKWNRDPLQHYAKYVQTLLGLVQAPAKAPKKQKPTKPLAKGKLAFVNCRSLDGDAVLAESPIHQQQFIEAMVMYCGIRKDTAEATLDAYIKTQDMFARSDFHIELWDVIEGGRKTPRFEYWVQGAGDGMIFEFGTDESPQSIGSTQHAFEAHGGDDEESAALVEALQAAADRTRGL